ncbi:MAG: heme-binding domain-containing protein [Bacteroidota bacterium]
MRTSRIIKWALLLALVGSQFIEVERTNPPVTKELQASAEVKNILRNACYDCHSNETVWPWYSNIAPVSFLIANHVNDGRRHLNFSTWGNMFTPKQNEYKKEIWEEIERGKMPIGSYTWLHPKAKLTPEQRKVIKSWSMGEKF